MITNKFLVKIFLILIFIPSILFGQRNETLRFITYPVTYFRLMDEIDNDNVTMDDIRRLNEDLEESIINKAQGEIEFEENRYILEDIHSDLGLQFQDFYNNPRITRSITDEFKQRMTGVVDGILFIALEEFSEDSRYVIKAKIVNLESEIITERSVKMYRSQLMNQLTSKLNILAENLINTLLQKKYRNFDTHRFLNFSTLSSFTVLTGSIIWYGIENSSAHDYYNQYKDASTYTDAVKYRINTEKSLSRRDIARNIAIISGTGLVFFIIRDFLWHPSIKNETNNNRMVNKNNYDIKPAVYCLTNQESFIISLHWNF